jgi:hypothetical protein
MSIEVIELAYLDHWDLLNPNKWFQCLNRVGLGNCLELVSDTLKAKTFKLVLEHPYIPIKWQLLVNVGPMKA